jgi:hypothetical protein
VAFVVTASFTSMSHCHCSMCRRQHGSAFSTYCETDAAGYAIERGAEAIVAYASSPEAERRFCGRCGTKLSFHAAAAPSRIWIAAGALDDDPGVRPECHIFVGSKAGWYDIADPLPQYTAYPECAGHD